MGVIVSGVQNAGSIFERTFFHKKMSFWVFGFFGVLVFWCFGVLVFLGFL